VKYGQLPMNEFNRLVLPNLVVQAHATRCGFTEDNRLVDAGSQILTGNSLRIRRSSPDTERELMRDSFPSIAAVNSVLSSRLSCIVSDKSIHSKFVSLRYFRLPQFLIDNERRARERALQVKVPIEGITLKHPTTKAMEGRK